MNFTREYQSKVKTEKEAAKMIRSGDRVYLAAMAGMPVDFANAVLDRYEELSDVNLHSAFLMCDLSVLTDPKYK